MENIAFKTDVGRYLYETEKPHAMSGIANVQSGVNQDVKQFIDYTPFHKISRIRQGADEFNITDQYNIYYGLDQQRIKTEQLHEGNIVRTRYYLGSYELDVDASGVETKTDYISAPSGLVAMQKNGTLYYVHTDRQGSIERITDIRGSIQTAYAYTAWGGRIKLSGTDITDRGYTGHEHLTAFQTADGFTLINMNGRVYDPVLARFLSPDPYVQAPDFTQSFNRYSYCLNNPFNYTDPMGEKWWHWLLGDVLTGGLFSSTALLTAHNVSSLVISTGLATYPIVLPFTNQGYELQKMISPVAIKPPFLGFGSVQNGIGFDISVGMPKAPGAPSYRYHFGNTYYFSSYGGYQGWESRSGYELSIGSVASYSSTYFKAGEFSQRTGLITVGDIFTNVQYENDWMFGMFGTDNGDRFRTAAVSFNGGPFSLNLNMFTGDPDTYKLGDRVDNLGTTANGHKYYKGGTANDPKLRAGVLSFGFGPFRMGANSEKIRHVFQNQFAHDFLTGGKSKWFLPLDDISSSFFWSFGTGTGNTLW